MFLEIVEKSQQAPVLESLFNIVSGFHPATLSKKYSGTNFFCHDFTQVQV